MSNEDEEYEENKKARAFKYTQEVNRKKSIERGLVESGESATSWCGHYLEDRCAAIDSQRMKRLCLAPLMQIASRLVDSVSDVDEVPSRYLFDRNGCMITDDQSLAENLDLDFHFHFAVYH